MKLHYNAKDLSGKTYGKLTVIKYVGSKKNRGTYWLCRCECGNTTEVVSSNLGAGKTRSCGCLVSYTSVRVNTTHGMSKTKIYDTWVGIKKRCTNPNYKESRYYMDRGIIMCDRWLNSFENFYKDMGDKPSEKHSIDRIDNDKGYSPENCRWATPKEQSNNRRPYKKAQV